MPNPQRKNRLERFLMKEIASILHTEMKDPSIGLVSVTGVQVSTDFKTARVKVSVYGGAEEKNRNMRALKRGRGYIQSCVAGMLRMRTVPEIRFELDESIEKSIRIGQIISKAVEEDRERAVLRGEIPGEPGEAEAGSPEPGEAEDDEEDGGEDPGEDGDGSADEED